jgi:D-sedoheptulose 7-phosphate isomerase
VSGNLEIVRRTLSDTIALHERVREADQRPLLDAVHAIAESLGNRGKLLVFGNGGSAADAQHVAADLVGRFLRERVPLAAVALTTDTSVLSSIANDYAFERVFARQIEAIGRRADVALGISTSGRSANVIAGLNEARTRGLTTVALTGGDGGAVGRAADIHLNVPSASTPRVQEVHRTLLHVMCDLLERTIEST